jgi:SAM-dependent methyltransferase
VDVTSRFVLDFARRYAAAHPGAVMLDFGCGAGRLVAEGRAAGLDLSGADVFYAGSNARAEAAAAGLLGGVVREIVRGRLPFADAVFDLVVNNQVLEHVENLDSVLAEIHRVLRPGGQVLSLFPARDVWREGHIGIPFAHWFRPGSRARLLYTWALRGLGCGTWKEQAPTCRQWAEEKLRWIDRFTRYRTRGEIFRTFDRYFDSDLCEPDYIRFRLRDRPGRAELARLLDLPLVPEAASALFRKLAFLVILSQRGPT